jgi:hypothetical protein
MCATDQMGCSFPTSRGRSARPWYTVDRKMSNNNVEQKINITFYMKSGKSVSEMIVLLTLALPLNGTGGSNMGEKNCIMTQEVGSQKCKGQMQMWLKFKPWCTQIKG